MTVEVDRIAADFAAKNWSSDPFGRFLAAYESDVTVAWHLVSVGLERYTEGGTLFDLGLGLLPFVEFEETVSVALETLTTGKHHNFAERRGAPDKETDWLNAIISMSTTSQSLKALLCLFETRRPRALETAVSRVQHVVPPHPTLSYLHQVGFSNPNEQLYSEDIMHCIFPAGYLSEDGPVWVRRVHPSWTTFSTVAVAPFGGEASGTCGLCRGALARLLRLPPVVGPEGVETTIAVCMSCLGWELSPLFYHHETADDVTPLHSRSEPITPKFPGAPLAECVVQLSVTPSRWAWQDWALSNSRENLHRVRGHPTWIQSAEYPSCPICKATMKFLLQLDSELPQTDGEDWLWGSGGILYVFWCSRCRVSGIFWQCT